MEFIKYSELPESFKIILDRKWIEKLKSDHKEMGFKEPEQWQISQHKERMIFNCVFYKTIQTPCIYYWSLINRI